MNGIDKSRFWGRNGFNIPRLKGLKVTLLYVPRTLSPARKRAPRREVRMTKSDKSLNKKKQDRNTFRSHSVLFIAVPLSRTLFSDSPPLSPLDP